MGRWGADVAHMTFETTTFETEPTEPGEPGGVPLVTFLDRRAYASTPLVSGLGSRVPRGTRPGTVIAHGRDTSRSMPADAAFITRARAEGRPVRTTTSEVEIHWVADGALESLSDLWLFEAWQKARAGGDAAAAEQARTQIRARGFILSAEDVYEDQIVYHDTYGWARVLSFSDEEWEAIDAGQPVPSVWLYPEHKPASVPYDPNGYMVEVQFADLDDGRMRDGDGQSPLIAVVAR